jgi:hypothetical protein
MFDSKRTFGIQLPLLAKESPPLLYAILAIGARQLERKEKTQSSFDSLELYQEAIRLLTPLISTRDVALKCFLPALKIGTTISKAVLLFSKHLVSTVSARIFCKLFSGATHEWVNT